MGGRVSFIANAHHPLAAAIDFYGSITPAALDLADKQLGPLLLFWAGLDEYIRPEGTRKAADALNEAKKDFTEVTFSHADHGSSAIGDGRLQRERCTSGVVAFPESS